MPKEINLGLRMNTFIFTCDFNILVVDVVQPIYCTGTDVLLRFLWELLLLQ
jgi:hypothetical protein